MVQFQLLRPINMSDSTDCSSEDLQRVPGLFRRWELPEVLEAERRYHIEDAGTHADGTPLVAVYANDIARSGEAPSADCRDGRAAQAPSLLPRAPVAETFISQRELADRWKVSPRTLERWRRLRRGPTYLKLGFRIVYGLRHIQAFEAEHLHVLRRGIPAPSSSEGERA